VKQLARLAFVAGAVAIGLFFLRAAPREVTLVYALGDAPPRALEVDIVRGGETVRHAEFRVPPAQLRHEVRLTDGDYLARLTLAGEGPSRRVERAFTVSESGTIVLPVAP
jgi:hypothetical protein